MSKWHYSWWSVRVIADKVGVQYLTVKAKSEETAIKRIEKEVAHTHTKEYLEKPYAHKINRVIWDTLSWEGHV